LVNFEKISLAINEKNASILAIKHLNVSLWGNKNKHSARTAIGKNKQKHASKLFCYRYATSKQTAQCNIRFPSAVIYAFIKVHSIISLYNIPIYVTFATLLQRNATDSESLSWITRSSGCSISQALETVAII